jgi:hypothetical protein
MGPEISRQLAQLRSLSRGQLLELWEKHYGKTPPKIRRELLVPFLAYRMQQKRYGGLKTSTRTELRRIARRERASRTCSGPLHDQPVYLGHSFLTDLLLLRIPFREPLAYDPRYPWIQDALRTAAEALSSVPAGSSMWIPGN